MLPSCGQFFLFSLSSMKGAYQTDCIFLIGDPAVKSSVDAGRFFEFAFSSGNKYDMLAADKQKAVKGSPNTEQEINDHE